MLMRSVLLCLVILTTACVPSERPPSDDPGPAAAPSLTAAPEPSTPDSAYPAKPASNAGGGGGGAGGGTGGSGGSSGGPWQ